jgi:phage-related minor tail protein
MDEEIERLVVSVRADTQGFAQDVATMRAELDGPFADGLQRAGRALESALIRAVRTGKFGFEDLKRTALAMMADIAAAAIRSGIGAIGGGGGLGGVLTSLLGSLLGLPGRATGGPVTGGRAYLVGERGPELFVPTATGRVESLRSSNGTREIKVAITVNAPAGGEARALSASSRQVARAVKAALQRVD